MRYLGVGFTENLYKYIYHKCSCSVYLLDIRKLDPPPIERKHGHMENTIKIDEMWTKVTLLSPSLHYKYIHCIHCIAAYNNNFKKIHGKPIFEWIWQAIFPRLWQRLERNAYTTFKHFLILVNQTACKAQKFHVSGIEMCSCTFAVSVVMHRHRA